MNLTETWFVPDGRPLCLRLVQPNDAMALKALYEGLSDQDRRRRFHGAVKGLSTTQLQRMTRADAASDIGLVAAARSVDGECLVADARCVVDATGEAAEFALVVSPGWRRRGVGRRCVQALLRAAGQRRLRWLYGSVLADNAPMLGLLQRCGFHCTPNRHDDRLVVVERLVGAPPVRRPTTAFSIPADALL